jgi:hypothetical protein
MDGGESWEDSELWAASENEQSLYSEREELNGTCQMGEAEEYWQRVRDEYLTNYSPGQLEANKIHVGDFDEAINRLAIQLVAGEL